MRWPLKNQISVRLILLLLLTIAAITYANIRSTIAEDRSREIDRVRNIAKMLRSSRFPMTSNVLDNMKSLSGAEFAVTTETGEVTARTSEAPNAIPVPSTPAEPTSSSIPVQSVEIADQRYLHAAISSTDVSSSTNEASTVHIFVATRSTTEVWWQASKTPLLIAGAILPVALIISLALAGQVTRPLARLRAQVGEIATGNIHQLKPGPRDDEVRDLNLAINDMATQLQDHDQQVRQNERLQTLLHVGSGLAHHLRNSATGCKMAVELMAAEHPGLSNSDNLDVARRQLSLMENYIQKFMSLAEEKALPHQAEPTSVDLLDVLKKVKFLLTPSASHLNVNLSFDIQGDRAMFRMSHDDAEQLMINLINNAITAASEKAVEENGDQASVNVDLDASDPDRIKLTVTDSGSGPPADIADRLFEPFVSGNREGTGLGLALVREIANRIGGRAEWRRVNNQTQFIFEFPSG